MLATTGARDPHILRTPHRTWESGDSVGSRAPVQVVTHRYTQHRDQQTVRCHPPPATTSITTLSCPGDGCRVAGDCPCPHTAPTFSQCPHRQQCAPCTQKTAPSLVSTHYPPPSTPPLPTSTASQLNMGLGYKHRWSLAEASYLVLCHGIVSILLSSFY